jgi:hypothetical protein
VKRLLVLVVALPLAAVLLIPASGSAQSTIEQINRATPQQVTLNVTPRRDRTLPYVFTSTGRVIPPPRYCAPGALPGPSRGTNCLPVLCPPGVTDIRYCLIPGRGVICRGTVTIRVQKRSVTISSRSVQLNSDCTYRSRVTFRTRLRTRIGGLTFQARFGGNTVLNSRNSAKKLVRAG